MTTRRGRLLRWFLALLGAVLASALLGGAAVLGSGDGQAALGAMLVAFHLFGVLGCVTCWWLSGWRTRGWAIVIAVLVVLAFTPFGLFAALIAPFWWAAGTLVAMQPPAGGTDEVA